MNTILPSVISVEAARAEAQPPPAMPLSTDVRPLPYSIEAESHLLSCCFLDDHDTILRCLNSGISKSSFLDPKHGIIFACMVDLHRRNEPTSMETVVAELTSKALLESVGGLPYISQAFRSPSTTGQVGYWITKVADLFARRSLHKCAAAAVEACHDLNIGTDDLSKELRTQLDRLSDFSPGIGPGITAAALCANPPTVPPELIARVLYAAGTMMLSGPSKSRKTYTFLDLGVSVATGSDWLGFATTKAPVIYINFELSEHSFQRRLAAICEAKQVSPPESLRSFNLRGKTATMDMLGVELPRLIKLHGAGLVILDPWYKISAQSGVEENSNDGQARILAEAERIVTANGASLVVGHHFSKGDAGSKNSIDRAAGAGAMARWGDVIATLSEHEEQDAMTLELHLRDFAPVAPIALRWQLPLWSRDAALDPAKLKKPAGRGDDHPATGLLSMLKDGMTNAEWNKASGWTDGTYRRKRDELLKAKKVNFVSGTYRRA